MKDLHSQVIKEYFLKKYSFNFLKIQESTIKRPDFEVIEDNKRLFVAELKTMEDIELSAQNGYYLNEDTEWFSRIDNSPARVARKIKESHKQLKEFDCLKVIIFFNRDTLDYLDLFAALTGSLPFKNNKNGKISLKHWYKNISEGDIKSIKKEIDLYIWVDALNLDKRGSEDFFIPMSLDGQRLKDIFLSRHIFNTIKIKENVSIKDSGGENFETP
jgi:hypothetical protein